MAQANIIQSLQGYFDVRDFNAKKPREQWAIKGNDTTISFGVKYETLPDEFKQYAKPYTDRNGNQRYIVRFKIGANCKWFDKTGTVTPRPDNTYLDGKPFEVTIQYATLNGDPTKKEASGYWCNAIMFREVNTNPFDGIAFEAAPAAPEQPATPVVQEAYVENFVDDAGDSGLPF